LHSIKVQHETVAGDPDIGAAEAGLVKYFVRPLPAVLDVGEAFAPFDGGECVDAGGGFGVVWRS
jgi:hypothetical protein